MAGKKKGMHKMPDGMMMNNSEMPMAKPKKKGSKKKPVKKGGY